MEDDQKTKTQLINELTQLRQRFSQPEAGIPPSSPKNSRDNGHEDQLHSLEESLKKQYSTLRSILESTTAFIYSVDQFYKYTSFNQKHAALMNIRFDKKIKNGRSMLDVITPPAERKITKANIDRALAGEKFIEFTTLFKDSPSPLYFEVSYNPIRADDGSVIGAVVFSNDITARKQADDQLQTLSRAVEQNPASIVITDIHGTIEYVNPRFTLLTGYTLEEMVGKNSRILKTGYTPPEEYTKMWKTILSGALWQGQFCNRKKNGELYWENASISPVSNPAGIVTHFVAVKEDITARKAAEDELFRSRQMLQLVLDNIPVQVFWKDRDLVYQGGNQVCAVEAGLHSPDEIIGKTDFDLSWKDLAQHYREDDQIILDTGMPKLNFEEPFPRPDGSQIWVRTKKVPLYSRDGKVIGVLGTSEDITERKQAEQEIAMANEKLISWVADLEQRNRDANLLRQMGDLLQVCNEHDAYYAIITKYIPQLFPSTSGALFITNDIHTSLEASTVWGEQLQSERTFAPDECWALRRGQIHKGMSSKSELNCQHIKKPLSGNYIDLPMLASGETIGVLHIESNYDDLFLENVQDLAHTLADHLSLSLSNLKLRETLRYQSTRDALTGLFNRRYMEESLARELPRAVRKNAPVGIIMLDIDHFKVFNDTYGHEAGDVVLREIGTLLRNQIRSEDIACRFGGEEFLLILPEANQEVTLQRAERIRAAVKAMRIDYCGQPLGLISVSLDVSVFPLHSAVAVGIIKKADEALYRAKNNGRDRVEVAPLS